MGVWSPENRVAAAGSRRNSPVLTVWRCGGQLIRVVPAWGAEDCGLLAPPVVGRDVIVKDPSILIDRPFTIMT